MLFRSSVNAAIWNAITTTLASLTQLLTAQAIGAVVAETFGQVTDTAFVGNNMVLTVNI